MKTNFIKSFSLLFFAITALFSCDSTTDEQVLPSANVATTDKSGNVINSDWSAQVRPSGQVQMYYRYSSTEWRLANVKNAKITLINESNTNQVTGTSIMTSGTDGKFIYPSIISVVYRFRYKINFNVSGVPTYTSSARINSCKVRFDPRNGRFSEF